MTLTSRILRWIARLPPAQTYDVVVERDLPVPMPDGAVLLADRYYPRTGGKTPTILVRSPYGRGGHYYGLTYGRPFAERGFQVLIQSCRGTFGSGGEFQALRHEREDGLATLDWIRRQPWYSGELATFGQSYLGYVQWAIAAEAGPDLKAMVPQITASEFHSLTYPGGSFALDTSLTWIYILSHQENASLGLLFDQLRTPAALRSAFRQLPLSQVDVAATGRQTPYFRNWLEHDQNGDGGWQEVDFSGRVAQVTAPVHLIGGWYDIFLPAMIADYGRLKQAGRRPYLTIGPWTHTSPRMFPVLLRESLAWFRAHLMGDREGLRVAPVRIYMMGKDEWRDFPEWPPPEMQAETWRLQPGGLLAPQNPPPSEPDHYRYDPADPTPSVGGSSLSPNSGPRDNRALEARHDILTYTSPPLDRDLEIAGPLQSVLYVRSSLEHTDFFVRLCDVNPSGRSVNLSDGLLRLEPGSPAPEGDGCLRVEIDLWPVAHCFKRGHRVRVQVSSGAHPRYARNLGSGEPLATAITLVPAEQSVYHDPEHPSALVLPIL